MGRSMTLSLCMESWASPPMRPPWAPLSPRPPAPSTSRCSSSFSVRRCPAPTPRRPSWPDGTCSTPPPPARWVSRPTVSPRLRSPRCSTRSNPLVANSTTANSPASLSAAPTSRFWSTLSNRKHPNVLIYYLRSDDQKPVGCHVMHRFINKDLGGINNNNNNTIKNQFCLPLNVEPGSRNRTKLHRGGSYQRTNLF